MMIGPLLLLKSANLLMIRFRLLRSPRCPTAIGERCGAAPQTVVPPARKGLLPKRVSSPSAMAEAIQLLCVCQLPFSMSENHVKI